MTEIQCDWDYQQQLEMEVLQQCNISSISKSLTVFNKNTSLTIFPFYKLNSFGAHANSSNIIFKFTKIKANLVKKWFIMSTNCN